MMMMLQLTVAPDVYELVFIGILFDGLLTLLNLGILAVAVKLISEFYKVTRLTQK